MEFDDLEALKQLIHNFANGDRPLYILCFDEEGNVVPWDMVFAASLTTKS